MTSTTTEHSPNAPNVQSADIGAQLAALSTVALAGYDLRFIGGVSAALLMLVATAPLWWRHVVEFEFALAIVALTGAAVIAGFYLAGSSSVDHVVSTGAQRSVIMHLAAGLAIMIALLWGRALLPLHIVAAVYGAGALADALISSPRSWKFDLALPVTIVVVGWLGRQPSRLPGATALVLLGVLSALDRGRSFFALCVLAAALVIWQQRPTAGRNAMWRWYPLAVLTGIGAATYLLATRLLVAGYFGIEAQQRTVSQIEQSGSLISGGRPEWAASVALFRERPFGYGVGVVPNTRDYSVAKSGMDSINVDAGGYLQNYMLGGGFRLHSVAADLWVSYGLVGLALAITIGFALVRTLSSLTAARRCQPLVALAVVLAVWNLLFGPIYSNWPDVCFALGITLMPRNALAVAPPDPPQVEATDQGS